MKFFIKGFYSECDQIRRKLRETAYLITFTEEILNILNIIFCLVKIF